MSKIMGLMGGGGGGGDDYAAQRRQEEQERQARIQQGMGYIDNSFAQFNDDYYSGRSQAYQDYYLPQVDRQFEDARKSIAYDLSRAGNLRSTAANEAYADLDRQLLEQRGAIIDRAQAEADAERNRILSERNSLVSQLQGSADPDAAQSSAMASANMFANAQPAYSPLANIFVPLTNTVANVVQGNRDRDLLRDAQASPSPLDPRYTSSAYTVG